MPDRFLKRKEVESLVGYSKASIYRLIDQGKFPKPIPYNSRCVRWRESDVVAWQQTKVEQAAPPERGHNWGTTLRT